MLSLYQYLLELKYGTRQHLNDKCLISDSATTALKEILTQTCTSDTTTCFFFSFHIYNKAFKLYLIYLWKQ